MKRLLLLLVLLVPVVSAVGDDSLFYYESLDITGSLSNPISIDASGSRADIDYLAANISWFPVDRPGQELLSFSTDPVASPLGDVLLFEVIRPKVRDYDFRVDFEVRTRAQALAVTKKVPFPLPPLTSDIAYFTQATDTIDQNQAIRELAAGIADGQDDLFLLVTDLAAWTKANIEYDLSTINVEASQPSSWVLRNREGVCDEMTNLFISLCRSLGVPARFVSGVSYTNSDLFDERWGPHGWAEVYFPGTGWVPFDVTYGQIGWVDPTHVVFDTGIDSGSYASSYSWRGFDVQVQPLGMEVEADVVRKGALAHPGLVVGVSVIEDEVGFGSYDVVMAEITNPTSFYLADEFTLAPTEDVMILDEPSVVVAVPPHASRSLYWRVLLSDDLDEGYQYTFPFTIVGQRNVTGSASLSATAQGRRYAEEWADGFIANLLVEKGDAGFEFSCAPPALAPRPGEPFVVECMVVNVRSSSLDIEVCGDPCVNVTVPPDAAETLSFDFVLSDPALHSLSFVADDGVGERFAYVSVEVVDEPDVSIESLSFPSQVDFDAEGVVHFEVVRSGAEVGDVVVSLVGPSFERQWPFTALEGRKVFDITVPGDLLVDERNNFSVSVVFEDDRGESSAVEESFVIKQGEVSWWQRILLWLRLW